MRYLQYVEGMRPDVRVIPVGFLTNAWFRRYAARHLPDVRLPAARGRRPIDAPFTFREFVDANAPRPVYIVNRVPWLRSLEEAYSLWPVGVVERVTPRAVPARPRDVRGRGGGLLRATRSGRGSRLPAGQLGGRHPQRLLETVRALRLRGRPPRGRPHRQSGQSPRRRRACSRRWPSATPRPPRPYSRTSASPIRVSSATRPDAPAAMVRAWRRYLAMAPADDADVPKIRQLVEEAERTLATRTAR